MSYKTVCVDSAVINCEPESIARLLLEVESLPAWNPALSYVEPGVGEGIYEVKVHNILRGKLTCSHNRPQINVSRNVPHIVGFHITIPGLIEDSTFTLRWQAQGTLVTHRIIQRGFLASIIGKKEAALVPGKRLVRLAQTLNNLH